MIKKFIAAALIALAGFTGVGIAQAGAAPTPCSNLIDGQVGPPYVGDNGWYWHGSKVMQCVQDSNNMIIRQWGAGGVDEGIVFNGWIPYNRVFRYIDVGTPNGATSKIRFCPVNATTFGVYDYPNHSPGWERSFYGRIGVGSTWGEGAINHFYGWSGTQAYGYAHQVNEGVDAGPGGVCGPYTPIVWFQPG